MFLDGTRRTRRGWVGGATVAMLVLVVSGCGQTPTLSPRGYELGKALYAACNYRSAEQLERFEALVAQSEAAEDLPAAEASALREAATAAQNGAWDEASQLVRELLAAQNREAKP